MFDKFVYRMALTLVAGFCLVLALTATGLRAQEDAHGLVNSLGQANFQQAAAIVQNLAKTGDPKVVPALQAFSDGDLYVRKSDNQVFIAKSSGDAMALVDPLTGQPAGQEAQDNLGKIKINNSLRRTVRAALGSLTLMSPDRGVRPSSAIGVEIAERGFAGGRRDGAAEREGRRDSHCARTARELLPCSAPTGRWKTRRPRSRRSRSRAAGTPSASSLRFPSTTVSNRISQPPLPAFRSS